jgi:transcriptional regulator with XRE-family HTH domain
MTGDRLRILRVGQQRSLADVASKAEISVATLSRIENDKQSLDLNLFLRLARILKVAASEILGDRSALSDEDQPLARTLADLAPSERTKVWRDLAIAKRQNDAGKKQSTEHLSAQLDELLAQIEFLRSELEGVRKRMRRTPPPQTRSRLT